MNINRRKLLQGAAVAAVNSPFIRTAAAAETIKIAAMCDLSGGLEVFGKPMLDAMTYAVDEINGSGGLLGKQIEVKTYDTQTNMQLYPQYAQEAALREKVAVVHGGLTSASREVIRPVLNKYKTLYFYETLYEGGVCDRNIFCTGSTPGQTVEKLVKHGCDTWGKKIYVLAADYNYGQITTQWVKKLAAENGGEVIGAEFFPLDATNFGSTISKIQAAGPSWIMTVLVGGATTSFYRQFAAAGMTTKIPMASTTFGTDETLVLAPAEYEGLVVCYNYMEAIDNPANKAFQSGFRKKFGQNYKPISELPMSSYQGIHLWAAGVKKAGNIERMAVIKALESGVSLDLPSGKVSIDPVTHHCVLDIHLGEFKNRELKILKSFPQQAPTDTASVCNLSERPNDNKQYVIKVN